MDKIARSHGRGLYARRWLVLLAVACLLVGAFGGLWWERSRPTGPGEGSVDVGFLRDMIYHHEQAVQMASITLADTDDPLVASMAKDILVWQRYEIGVMTAWLGDWGLDTGELDRTAMAWMNAPVPLAVMPGIQEPDRMEALRDASGDGRDRLFLDMMIEHHAGGVHMAEYASEHADWAKVRDFAGVLARNQQGESAEYRLALDRQS
jgi:uncharacterized protein (DUF305 family)